MKINTLAIEKKYKDVGLKILKIEPARIEKLNYNKVTYEFFYVDEVEYYADDIDEVFDVKSKRSSKLWIIDEVLVRVDRNLAQALINHLNGTKKEHTL